MPFLNKCNKFEYNVNSTRNFKVKISQSVAAISDYTQLSNKSHQINFEGVARFKSKLCSFGGGAYLHEKNLGLFSPKRFPGIHRV